MEFGDDLKKEELYNKWHREQPGYKNSAPLYPWHKTVLDLLPQEFTGKILEIGCGNGDFSILLAEKYPKATVTGVDFARAAIEAAEKKVPDQLSNVIFQVENAEKLSFNDYAFDLVISCETIEHVFNPQKMVNEIYRILKPEHRFLLTTENYFNGLILAWLQSRILRKPFNSGSGVQPHENFMLFYKTKKFFTRAGFKRISTYSSHYQWLLLPGVAPKLLCTPELKNRFIKQFFKPFGRHYTYTGVKPSLC